MSETPGPRVEGEGTLGTRDVAFMLLVAIAGNVISKVSRFA